MNATVSQLQKVRVADVMNRDVVTVSANSDMSDAARVLFEHGIHGMPVVDERGKCVGVLSLTDFSRRNQLLSTNAGLPSLVHEFVLERHKEAGTVHIERKVEGYVRKHMSDAVQSIGAEQSLLDASRYMDSERIHRLIVLDEAACPVGIISALDIIGAFVELAEE